jgi:hypothetical protein
MPLKVNINTRIRFNGQDYDSVEAMPTEARAAYEQVLAQGTRVTTASKIVFNGREYAGPHELPLQLRAQYDKLIGQLGANHNGILDVLEKGAPTAQVPLSADDALSWMESLASKQDTAPAQVGTPLQSPANFPVVSAEPPRSRRWMVTAVALVILLAGLAALLVALLLYSQSLPH